MADAVLTINAGSSSLKFSVYRISEDDRLTLAAKGQVEGIGTSPRFVAEDAAWRVLVDRRWPDDRGLGSCRVLSHDRRLAARAFRRRGRCWRRAPRGAWRPRVRGAGRVDPAVVAKLEALCPLAPLHQPHNLAAIRAIAAVSRPPAGRLLRYRVPPRPSRARRLVRAATPVLRRRHPPLWLPRPFLRVHRERAARGRAGDRQGPRGGRPSRQRRQHVRDPGRPSIDSTMGFTALDGLPMGTRCGALDPGVVLHLIRAYGMDADAIERMLYHDCGLKGVSGHQQRHARPARERRPARRAGDRPVRLSHLPRARRACCGARRTGRPRIHGRDRRALARDPGRGSASTSPGSASSSTMRRTGRAGRASRPRAAGSRCMRSRPTRS